MPVRLGAVPARNRDVELRVAPHAVLRDVQAGGLDVFLDADPPEALERPEAAERGRERESADGQEAERLDPELVERARVEKAAPPGRKVRRERRHREDAGREGSPDAGESVDGDGADRVVDPDPLDER